MRTCVWAVFIACLACIKPARAIIPVIPEQSPEDLFPFYDDLDEIGDRCRRFQRPWFEALFIPRELLNSYFCYWIRYLYPIPIVGWFFETIFTWAYFDARPDLTIPDANCGYPEDAIFCFVISLAPVIKYIVIPAFIIIKVLLCYSKLLKFLLNETLDIVEFFFHELIKITHAIIYRVSKHNGHV